MKRSDSKPRPQRMSISFKDDTPEIQVSSAVETSFGAAKTTTLAVKAQNICLSYRTSSTNVNYVLNGINMNVPKGAIYGLLGPSGCGKTSLLSLIIGVRKPECGLISIFGYEPGTKQSGVPGPGVGYMPQDIALQLDLTIEEMILYFGRLYCLDEDYLKQQVDYLVDLLQLPTKKRLIANLSGGQQRRVSLAVTLVHKPRLVILDEPTVGVDPLLCKTIWDLLVRLSNEEKMSIIITTHYIEECRRSQVVGFMRKGQILAEDSPDKLMKRYSVDTLEQVFYSLCFTQKQRKSVIASTAVNRRMSVMDIDVSSKITYGSKEPFRPKVTNKNIWYIFMIRTLIWKYVIQTIREPGATVIMFVFPSFALGILCICIGGTPFDVPVAWVVDEPRPNISSIGPPLPLSMPLIATDSPTELPDMPSIDSISEITEAVDPSNEETSGEPKADEPNGVETEPKDKANEETSSDPSEDESDSNDTEDEDVPDVYFPDLFRQSINQKVLKLINYTDLKTALRDAKERKIWGAIYMGRNFSKDNEKISLFLNQDGEDVDNETFAGGTIYIQGDYADKFMMITVTLCLQQALIEFIERVAEALGKNPLTVKLPIDLNSSNIIYGSSVEGDYFGVRDFAAPGFLLCLTYSISYAISMLSIISEIHDQMFSRNYSAGLTAFQIVIGQIIARFIFLGIGSMILLISTVYVFGVPCHGSFILASALLLLQTLVGMTHGMVMGTVIPSIFACCFITTGMFLLIFFVSGVFWPLESLPYYLNWLSRSMPFTLPGECLRTILIRKNAPFHPLVWPGFAISFAWFTFFVIMSVVLFRTHK